MFLVFQRELGNGKIHLHYEEDWDHLKIQLSNLDTFPFEEWEVARYTWENLREGHIINDGSFLWQYFEVHPEAGEIPLFEGSIVFLNEINPIF